MTKIKSLTVSNKKYLLQNIYNKITCLKLKKRFLETDQKALKYVYVNYLVKQTDF